MPRCCLCKLSGPPSFAAFLDAFQHCQPARALFLLKQPAPSVSFYPCPSQGLALRSLRFYSVSTVLVLSSLSVHKFQESSGRVITFEHCTAMLLTQRSVQSELLPSSRSPLLHIFASFPTLHSRKCKTIRRENRKKPQTLGEHLLKEDEAELN